MPAPPQLNTTTGLLNTLVLITSSFFVASAVPAIKRGLPRRCVYWLLGAIAAGLASPIKTWEYSWNDVMGISARSNYFFATYYYITFNHLLHVLVGTVTLASVAILTATGHFNTASHTGLEGAASYWHMIDLVWILIFPLLYHVLR